MIRKTAFLSVVALIAFSILGPTSHASEKLLPIIEANEEGVYVQPWFIDSFLDLREDMAEARDENKQLVILWEQRGCPYCREMHMVNLRKPEIVSYIRKHFNVLQLNLWGSRKVTDLDGEVLSEKKLARKYRVQFTPTLQYMPDELAKDNKRAGHDVEVWRLLGYWKPFHFLNSFVYVRDKGYESQPNFQRWLQAHAEELRRQGKDVKLW